MPVSDALDGDDGLSKAPPPVPAGLVSASLGNTPSAQLPSAPIRRAMATPVVLRPTLGPAPASNVPATETPSPAPAPARPTPVPPPVVVEKPPVKSGNTGMMLGAAALLLTGVSAAVVLLSVGIGAWFWVGDAPTAVVSTQPSVEAPSEVAPEAPAEAEPSMGDVEPEEGARFLSMAAGTRKVSVRCEGGSASGKDSAVVIGDTIGDCTVTALDGDRKRWIALVKEVESVEYRCFVDGKKECNPIQG